jgi:hypothetical protein
MGLPGRSSAGRVLGLVEAWRSVADVAHELGPLTALTWAPDAPLVTVIDLALPGLMARQWPGMTSYIFAAVTTSGVALGQAGSRQACRLAGPAT